MGEQIERIYGVAVNGDDTVSVVSVPVTKETSKKVWIGRSNDYKVDIVFGYNTIKEKDGICRTPREALERYIKRRQEDKQRALAVVGQATKQIASANELLMKEPGAGDLSGQ